MWTGVGPSSRDAALTRDGLDRLPRRRIHAGRNVLKATVEVVEVDGRPVAVKDFACRSWPVRLLLGPRQLDRETRAYRLLEGVRGTPRFLGRVDRQAIAIEYVPGRDLAAARPGDLPESFFDRLDLLLQSVHAAGVAHGDLHHRDVLAGPGGEPWLVDFSTSISVGPAPDPLLRLLFRQMCRADRRSVAKLRHRFHPGSRRAVPPPPALYRIGRWLKRLFDSVRPVGGP